MRIIVDGDACPSKQAIKKVAKKYHLEAIIYVDTAHVMADDYMIVKTISQGADAVDMAIANDIQKSDVLITQDYGLASLTLLSAYAVIHPNGFRYTLENIDAMLMQRHLSAKARRSGKHHTKHKKRSNDDELALITLLSSIIEGNPN